MTECPVQATALGDELDPASVGVEQTDGLVQRALQDVARMTRGAYFAARDTAGLTAACRAIDRLERSPIASYQYRRYHEAYPWVALAAFVLFSSALFLEQTLWRRLP